MQTKPSRASDMTMDPEQLFKVLADSTRLRMLMLLVVEGELCVCELTHALGEIQPKISRHLALLRESGMVLDRRQGQWIYYRINPELPGWVREVLAATAEGATMRVPFDRDLRTLADMPDRPEKACCG
jgi:ArsR family transcriptional regulator